MGPRGHTCCLGPATSIIASLTSRTLSWAARPHPSSRNIVRQLPQILPRQTGTGPPQPIRKYSNVPSQPFLSKVGDVTFSATRTISTVASSFPSSHAGPLTHGWHLSSWAAPPSAASPLVPSVRGTPRMFPRVALGSPLAACIPEALRIGVSHTAGQRDPSLGG